MQNGHGKKQTSGETGKEKKKKPERDDKQIVVANPIGGITEPLRHLPSPSAAAVN
jgi:hypothetical protein